MNFCDGLAGMGWTMDYLIKNKFIDADEDILEEIDDSIESLGPHNFIADLPARVPLFSKGIYFIGRGKHDILRETLMQYDYFLSQNSTPLLSVSYINSVLYFIIYSIRVGADPLTAQNIIERLYPHMDNSMKNKKYKDRDILLLQKNISDLSIQFGGRIDKWTSVFDIAFPDMTYSLGDYIYDSIPSATLTPEVIQNFIDINITSLNNDLLTINEGLAGIGLNLLKPERAG